MTNEEVMCLLTDMGLHEGGMENWIPDNAWVRVVNKTLSKRKWVGLTVNEARMFYEKYTDREELIYAIDKFLEEKNG